MWFGKKQQVPQAQPAYPEWRHKSAHPLGGFNLSIGDNSNTQAITGQIFKQIGAKMMFGDFGSILSFSKPIAMSVEMSFLHQTANGQIYCSILEQAADLEPIEQLKYLTAYMIAGLHANGSLVKLKSPLDPLLGETLQLQKEDGIQFYAEQTSFDPPICNFQIIGKNFTISGVDRMALSVHKTLNSLSGKQIGGWEVKFKNGSTYKCIPPQMEITGLVMGERIMNFSGKGVIKGEKYSANVNFNYNTDGMMKKLTSFFSTPEQAKIFDIVEVDIIENIDGVEKPIVQGIGSWLEDLKFGEEQQVWKITDEWIHWNKSETILDSDSSKRKDLQLMLENKLEDAQKAKIDQEALNYSDSIKRKQVAAK